MNFLLHLLSIFADTPTEKAELAVGKVVLKWIQRGMAYAHTPEGQGDIDALVELAKDFGATIAPPGSDKTITLPATPTHPQTTYAGSGGKSIYIGVDAVK